MLAFQVTALFTKMSPLPAVPASVAMETLPRPRLVESVPAPIPETVNAPLPDAMVKSTGSISQEPLLPLAAWVVMTAPSATLTWAAEVSTKPPSPPFGAEASSVPPTLTVP